jgi:hypothetical protein
MTRLTGSLALRVTAWLVAIAVTTLLWVLAERLDYAIYCWPSSLGSGSWRLVRLITFAAMLPVVALPAAATLFSNRHPRLSVRLAVAAIVLPPVACIVLYQWAPAWPR